MEMATLGGATALGMGEHIGSLEVGKRADLVIANPGNWDLQPVYDPMFTASRGLTGRDVETVVVDGDVVVDKGTGRDGGRRRAAGALGRAVARDHGQIRIDD